MVDVSGIPNLGIPGLSGFNGSGGVNGIPGSSGLDAAQTQYELNRRFFGNQANTLAAAEVPQAQLYGGGFFGAQPAHYAGVGASYGRATGGFGGYGAPNADPFTPVPQGGNPSGRVTRGPDLPDLSPSMPAQPQIPYLSGGGMPFGGGGFGRNPTVFDTGTSEIPNLGGGGAAMGGGGFGRGRDAITQAMMQQPSGGFQMPKSEPAGGQSFIEPDLASRTGQLRMPNSQQLLGYNPETSATFAPGGGNQFASRFGFHNAGMPSEYTTSPYEDASGRVHQPSQLPPGFSSPYSFDNPGGALGRGGFRGTQAPVMNSSDDTDTLTAQDTDIPHGGFNGGSRGTGFTSGTGTIGAPEGGFNSYGLPGGGGMGSFGGRGGGLTTVIGTIGDASSDSVGGIGSDMRRGGQDEPYAKPWHDLIPSNTGLNTPEIIKQVNYTAGRGRYDPAALANVIDTESKWNPQANTGSYFGATQMGAPSFREAGGRLGGMTLGQYQQAPLEQQIPAYGDWLSHYAQPGNAAGLASSGIRNLPVPMQSAILQGTQFGPNSTNWPAALAEGNMGMSTTPHRQASFLGVPPTINSMNAYFGRR